MRMRKVAVCAFILVYFLSVFSGVLNLIPEVFALSDETTVASVKGMDSTQQKSCKVGDFMIYASNRTIVFYKDDETVKTFYLTPLSNPISTEGLLWYINQTSIISYNSTHVLVGWLWAYRWGGSHYHHEWLDYWIINVNSLGYSQTEAHLVNSESFSSDCQGDLILLSTGGYYYALCGGCTYAGSTYHTYIVTMYETYAVFTGRNYVDCLFYGVQMVIPHASDPDMAYIISRSSHTSSIYRIFRFDADAKTLTIVATGSTNHYSDFAYYAGYLTHTIYGNLYYDILFAYPDLTATETLYVQFSRFNDTYLSEERLTMTPSSTVDKLRPFSILYPSGVTGEDDLNNGYYSVVFVGASYNLQQIVFSVSGIETTNPALHTDSGAFSYQSKTHYYEESNIGGWQPTAWTIGTYIDYTNGKMIADTFTPNEEPAPPTSYSAEVASVPEINIDFYVGSDTYQTPDTVTELYGYYYFTAKYATIHDGQGYLFDHWLINGVTEYTNETILLLIEDDATVDIYYEETELYIANVTSVPEIAASFTVDDTGYSTPEEVYVVPDNHTFVAQQSKVLEGQGYVFEHWLINGTTEYATTSITLNITANTTLAIHYANAPVFYCPVSSNPEIGSAFWVDSDSYHTPETVVVVSGLHAFTSESAKITGGTAYEFSHWRVNSTTNYYSTAITLTITGNTTLVAYFDEITSLYTLYGVYNETTGLWMKTNCTVTVYFSVAQPNYEFTLNGTYNYIPDYPIRYFHFDLGDYDREYWVGSSEYTATIYVFNDTLTDYTINFMDFCGALTANPYVEAKFYVNGTLFTVDKRKVDEQTSIEMSLKITRKYSIVISGVDVSYVWGDLLMTSQTSVQLVLKAIDFPKETLLMYRYLRVYSFRELDTPIGTITVYFQDVQNTTDSVDIVIAFKNGTIVFSATETSQSFSLIWSSANNATDYKVEVTIHHDVYGDLNWRQYLPRGMSEAPWSLDFLGTFPFTSAYLLPMLLIVFVAGCFSVINAEVGAVLAVITAAVLTYLGWIPISSGALVTAFALALLMGLAYAKRRLTIQ